MKCLDRCGIINVRKNYWERVQVIVLKMIWYWPIHLNHYCSIPGEKLQCFKLSGSTHRTDINVQYTFWAHMLNIPCKLLAWTLNQNFSFHYFHYSGQLGEAFPAEIVLTSQHIEWPERWWSHQNWQERSGSISFCCTAEIHIDYNVKGTDDKFIVKKKVTFLLGYYVGLIFMVSIWRLELLNEASQISIYFHLPYFVFAL